MLYKSCKIFKICREIKYVDEWYSCSITKQKFFKRTIEENGNDNDDNIEGTQTCYESRVINEIT